MTRREFNYALGGLALPGLSEAQTHRNSWKEVRAFGAKADGSHLDTTAIQAAVDACAQDGGGVVWFAPGTYRSGTIRLRSHVKLHFSGGATLLGSTDLKDYPVVVPKLRSYTDAYTDKSLLYGEGLSGVSIVGDGIIDGQGASFHGPYKLRPYLIRLVECRRVLVRDIELRNSPMWVQHYLACDDVRITGIRVRSRVNQNNDGIDIDACSAVRISDCHIISGDDSIVLKSTTPRACQGVVVTNCVVSSLCNGLKLGTESTGGFSDIVFGNCVVYDTRLAGIALEAVDGGVLERVTLSNISMRNVNCPIFVRLGDRARPYIPSVNRPPTGAIRNVMIKGIQATGADKVGCPFAGIPGHPIQNLTLRDITMSFEGGGSHADATRSIPEETEQYPEYKMFGILPGYGLFGRHVQGLRIENVRCIAGNTEARPALFFDHVQALEMAGVSGSSEKAPLVRLRNVHNARLLGLGRTSGSLLDIGPGSTHISVACPQDQVTISSDVNKDTVTFEGHDQCVSCF